MRSTTVMDHNNIPSCALYRHIGTVIVRIKMEVSSVLCCQRTVCPASECPDSIHRPSGCEQCTRTRLISKCGCDSDIVDKCRPYRSSSARSRYVNVCAAVCLLLLVGGLSPKSSAAPGRSRAVMERQRRASDPENSLWANPCDYADSNSNVPNAKEVAPKLIAQARYANTSTAKYQDTFAKELHSNPSFSGLIKDWDRTDWLRKFSLAEEVLPKEKVLNKDMPDEYINKLMNKIDDVLPSMYKALKIIVAGLHSFSNELGVNIISDQSVKNSINQTMHDVRAVLCYFSDIMKARKLEILPLPDSEAPVFNQDTMLTDGPLLYRDTLNYLEYLVQVFQKLYPVDA